MNNAIYNEYNVEELETTFKYESLDSFPFCVNKITHSIDQLENAFGGHFSESSRSARCPDSAQPKLSEKVGTHHFAFR